jgi:hypothetical protein
MVLAGPLADLTRPGVILAEPAAERAPRIAASRGKGTQRPRERTTNLNSCSSLCTRAAISGVQARKDANLFPGWSAVPFMRVPYPQSALN